MKSSHSLLIVFSLMILFIVSCSQSHENRKAETSVVADESMQGNGFISSSAAVEKNDDSLRQFIRTAEMKFRVKNVIDATYEIEAITSRFNGFVTYTNLASNMNYQTTVKVSADSSLEMNYYTVNNSMVLRIPNVCLDTLLRSIGRMVDYMDYRIIKAEDVGLELLSNRLKDERLKRHEKRLTKAIDQRGKKLYETTDAEDNLLYKQEQADNAMLANLGFQDRIEFSTVSLDLYQKQEVKKMLVANERNIDEYEPAFGKKVLESFVNGWKILESVILFFIPFWGLFLVLILIWFLYRKFGYKLKRNS